MFLSKSGANFLESSNAKRLEKNRLRLANIEQSLSVFYENCKKNSLNPKCLWLYEKEREKKNLESAIVRAEFWLKKE
tara:strand:+ start:963 stop:1193 length:231 start_codon:yes stop_codon:yes gene_type:complete